MVGKSSYHTIQYFIMTNILQILEYEVMNIIINILTASVKLLPGFPVWKSCFLTLAMLVKSLISFAFSNK